jgi:hypothetical protein
MKESTARKRWAKMSIEEKLEWNGFEGYCKKQPRKSTNLFMPMRLRKK